MPNRDAWLKRRAEAKHRLVLSKGGVCADCGGAYPDCCFDFDHRDPSAKSMNIGRMLCRVPWEQIQAEVDACDMVCANCHRIRTAASVGIREKMRRSATGRPRRRMSKATREKIRIASTGRTMSPETRLKISTALKGNCNARQRTESGQFA